MSHNTELRITHYKPVGVGDKIAFGAVKFMRFFADVFFRHRYGHRAVVLETVAAVPGMVGGMLNHLKSLRRIQDDRGWIKILLDEAENERAHLMTFIGVAKPNWFERFLIVMAQGIFFNGFFMFYLLWPRVAHRFVGYLEEEAVYSYSEYLAEIDAGKAENIPAPAFAIKYWNLPADARLRDVVIVVRQDEAGHRDVNHDLSDQIAGRSAVS
jgi:ubiquinol oxidase